MAMPHLIPLQILSTKTADVKTAFEEQGMEIVHSTRQVSDYERNHINSLFPPSTGNVNQFNERVIIRDDDTGKTFGMYDYEQARVHDPLLLIPDDIGPTTANRIIAAVTRAIMLDIQTDFIAGHGTTQSKLEKRLQDLDRMISSLFELVFKSKFEGIDTRATTDRIIKSVEASVLRQVEDDISAVIRSAISNPTRTTATEKGVHREAVRPRRQRVNVAA